MKKILSIISLSLLSVIAYSQALPAGSIAFIGFQGDSPMAFSMVNTLPLPAGTQISFTDNKWSGQNLLDNEQTVTWTSPDSILPTGTIFRLQDNDSGMTVTGPGTAQGRVYHSLGQGEQILAYTGPSTSPNFIAGISNSTWRQNCDSIPYLQYRTCLPPPLINGLTALAFLNITTINIDNGYLNITPLQVTGPEMLSIIYNINYWNLDNGPAAGSGSWPNWNSGSTQPFASSINFTQASVQVLEGGSLATITLAIDPIQLTPQSLVLDVLEFPGITSSDYATNPPVVNGHISFNIPANASSISFTFQAIVDGVAEVNENVSFLIGAHSGGITPGDEDAIAVTIISNEQNFSQVSFAIDTLVITEGQAGSFIPITVNPVSSAVYSVVVNSNNGVGVMSDYFTTPVGSSGQLLLQTVSNDPSLGFTITPFNDTQIEADEYVTYTIVQVSNGLQIGELSTIVVRIVDNDNIPEFIAPAIVLNELNAFNQDFPDEFGQLDDWIELYNADTMAVNLAGYYITNLITNPTRFMFPPVASQTTIQPGEFKILWADQNTVQGPLHLNFQLTETGGFLGLFAPDAETLIDGVQYPALDSLKNYGRLPDGNDNWKYIFYPTPGAPNSDSIPLALSNHFQLEDNFNAQFSAFPNPTSDRVTIIKKGKALDSTPNPILIDLTGKIVDCKIETLLQGKSWTISMQYLPAGIYLMRFNESTFEGSLRLIHQ
jgi:hypothetical protein